MINLIAFSIVFGLFLSGDFELSFKLGVLLAIGYYLDRKYFSEPEYKLTKDQLKEYCS